MYGLLLENLAEYIKSVYGEEKWEEIRKEAGISSPTFGTHTDFDESLLIFLAETAQEILGVEEKEFMDQMGVYFVEFVGQYGYDRVLSVLGRHVRDFLNGLDNLHEYLKFSYPLMRAPSFICENETRHGLTLHYRTKRRGFVYYVCGQIREVARHFYHKDMQIDLIQSDLLGDTCHYTFQLSFDNRAFSLATLAMTREPYNLPICANVLFQIFPFCIVFGPDMVVRSIGNSLMVILPDLIGKKIIAWFSLKRPMIEFKFQTILNRTNNIFELVTNKPVKEIPVGDRKTQLMLSQEEREAEGERRLRLKGQMIYMDNWKMIMFLGTPVMPKLTSLISTGLYINDLSMHDFSRDLMLAGTQQSVELKLALDQEQQKSKKLEESMRKLDEEMRRTDELLYQMIPKQVADRLRRGENPIDTCEMFDSVSILFSDVVTFTEICSRISPMQVVSMLNAMYSIFDTLTEKNNVYKVVSGAPEKEANHAEKTCDMALDMIDAITDLKDPSTGQHLRIRVGVHSGAVVAGIVGLKMPRYCLFGDSVNTASRMESSSAAMKIHISQTTKIALPKCYQVSERGEIEIKGKGSMKTYWLESCNARKPLTHPITTQFKIADFSQKKAIPVVSQQNDFKQLRRASLTTSRYSAERKQIVYTPITFEETAKLNRVYSPRTSCESTKGRQTRSNSFAVGISPSDVFGSLISDTEDFFEDLNHRNSISSNISSQQSSRIFSPSVVFTLPNTSLSKLTSIKKSNHVEKSSKTSNLSHEHHKAKCYYTTGNVTTKNEESLKSLYQLQAMVENLKQDESSEVLPGMCLTTPPNSVTDSQLYRGVLIRNSNGYPCLCHTYENSDANGYKLLKSNDLHCCNMLNHGHNKIHSHACSIL